MFILWEKLPEPPEINLLEFEKSITPLPVDNELIALFSGISSIIEDKNKEIVALKIEIAELKKTKQEILNEHFNKFLNDFND